MSTYEKASLPGTGTPGHDCAHCGLPAFAHEKERVIHDDGRWSHRLKCPPDAEADYTPPETRQQLDDAETLAETADAVAGTDTAETDVDGDADADADADAPTEDAEAE